MSTQYIQYSPLAGSTSWKPVVASVGALPSVGNIVGDTRVTLDTFSIYIWNGSAWILSSGSSGVTSVALTLPASVFSVSGSPVTTSGTLAGSFVTQTANTIFAGPSSGGAASPTFRGLVSADIPNNAANTTGTASNVTGIVAIANGGTGQATASAGFNALSPMTTLGDIIIGGSSGSGTRLGIGSAGQFLSVSGGSPAWVTLSAVTSITAFGSTPNANGGSISAGALTLQPADGTNPGGVSILAQTFAGVKTFSSNPIFSGGTANGVLYLDGSKNVSSGASLVWDGTTFSTLLAIQLNKAGTAAAQGVIFNNIGTGSVAYSGGTSASSGGALVTYGAAHGAKPGWSELQVNGSTFLTMNAAGQVGIGADAGGVGSAALVKINQNAKTRVLIANTNAGTSALAQLSLSTNADDFNIDVGSIAGGALASIGTGSGITGGLTLDVSAGAFIIRTGGSQRLSIPASGTFNWTGGDYSLQLGTGGAFIVKSGNSSAIQSVSQADGRSYHGFYIDNGANATIVEAFSASWTPTGTYDQPSNFRIDNGAGMADLVIMNRAAGNSIKFVAGGTGTGNLALTISPALNVVMGNAALSTSATDGFFYMDSCAGTPTGTPTSFSGRVPVVIDTTGAKLWAYIGGTWRPIAFS